MVVCFHFFQNRAFCSHLFKTILRLKWKTFRGKTWKQKNHPNCTSSGLIFRHLDFFRGRVLCLRTSGDYWQHFLVFFLGFLSNPGSLYDAFVFASFSNQHCKAGR